MKNPKFLLLGIFSVFITQVFAQHLPSSALYHELLRFEETKRVLYIAAHPDDENTRLIAYLANAENAQVAYLSLTRGDGGQNLIGKELGIELGMIRTNELLKARETDGGRQLFSRALDFGFSKNPDETFNNWDREKLLSDVIWIIRNYQPDIIINRFNTIPGTTHGHHTSSAILSVEAFTKAADASVFSEQLNYTKPWQAKRIFWNAYQWGGQYEPEEGKVYHEFEVGEINPFLGDTYSQIAANSRTMHKSQGFGSTAQVGKASDFIEMIDGESFELHPFEGIENRWMHLRQGTAIAEAIQKAVKEFDFLKPESNLENLLGIKLLLQSEDSQETWFQEKKEHLDQLILDILGVKAEFIIKKEIGYPGEKINVEFVFNNPSASPIQLKNFGSEVFSENLNVEAKNNEPVRKSMDIFIPKDYPVSQPFWLENPLDNSLFGITEQKKIGPPVNGPNVYGMLDMSVSGYPISVQVPLEFKYNDQVDGEVKQPFTLVPEVNVSLDKNNVFLIPGADDKLEVEVSFRDRILQGKLEVIGLEQNQFEIFDPEIDERRKRLIYTIQFKDSDAEKKSLQIRYLAEDGRSFNQDTKRIIYKHIPNLTYFTHTDLNLVKMDLKISGQKIGYIPGAGDDLPDFLRSLGYEVSILEESDLSVLSRLKDFKTVIVGIRAFNVNQSLASNMDKLMEYVNGGGNMIVQYNTASPLLTRELGPFPFNISRDRVTVEGSPVKADFKHALMSSPNQVQEKDFDGWVQERGLYFVSDWDEQYDAPLIMQDPGENASKGSLIHAKYGKGTYTYSGISWFRQLPAGVPGAVKIFVNLIEQASEN